MTTLGPPAVADRSLLLADPPVSALGDAAVVVDLTDGEDPLDRARDLADALRGRCLGGREPGPVGADEPLEAVEDVVATDGWVTVVATPGCVPLLALAEAVARLARDLETATLSTPSGGAAGPGRRGRVVELPLRFGGPDVEEVARQAGLPPEGVAAALADARLRVAFLGFAPGFAYLTGLPPALGRVTRRPRPRTRVPAGSVALGGGYAGVYPGEGPGGWQVVGATEAVLFDPRTPPRALLAPGDEVRFLRAPTEGPPRRPPRSTPAGTAETGGAPDGPVASDGEDACPPAAALEVLDPGLATTVQDNGRRGLAHLGVPRSGAADAFARVVANRLVGNDERSAVLEATLVGPVLRARAPLLVAVVGAASPQVDGFVVPTGAVLSLEAGQVLSVGRLRAGCRAVVAVAGGIEAPVVAGSRSTDTLSGLGPPRLGPGQCLAVGRASPPARRAELAVLATPELRAWARRVGLAPGPADPGAPVVLRLVLGPDAGLGAEEVLRRSRWAVAPESDRVGLRLIPCGSGDLGGLVAREVAPTRGVATGAVQWTPGGELVVLLADHATTGGYPLLGGIATVDVPLAAELRPGDAVELMPVDAARAFEQARRVRALLPAAAGRPFPVAAG
jgi:KipI family sensor histidine kinase inhibitor